jgi:hypothetical protein
MKFEKGSETTAYVSGDARLDECGSSADSRSASDASADRRITPGAALTNADIVQMQKAGLSEEITLSTISGSAANFNIGAQGLIGLEGSRRKRQDHQRDDSEVPGPVSVEQFGSERIRR